MTSPIVTPTRTLPEHVPVLVVGAGFGGLGIAVRLRERGRHDFVVLDKGDTVGGTWRDNTYPGAACDVPSQLYSFSFAPNKEWSRSFSGQPEIWAYLERVARDAGVLDAFRFGVEVTGATWDDAAQRWDVTTSAGDLTADVVVNATGALSEPKMPDIDGIDSFAGEVFHTARWDHDARLAGKRVAVIGTGASAIQIVPEIAEVTGHLDVYQRTAPWVIPRHDRTYPAVERLALRHVPGLQRLYRTAIYWGREGYVPAFTRMPALVAPVEAAARRHIARGIADPDLRRRVTPDFRLGCKRILISNTYYPTLDRPDVDVVTDPIRRITPSGIVTRDETGAEVERPVDAIVVATGFHATDPPIAAHVVGRAGETMADIWAREGMAAYKGTTVAGFPNLFFIVGPNTGLGHSSMVFVIESQIAYILDALDTMHRRGVTSLEPLPEAQAAWNEDLQRRMRRTVWSTGGCASWYLDAHGRNTTLWPRATFTMRALFREFDPDRYTLRQVQPAAAAPVDEPLEVSA